jgi:hypothetical protein
MWIWGCGGIRTEHAITIVILTTGSLQLYKYFIFRLQDAELIPSIMRA